MKVVGNSKMQHNLGLLLFSVVAALVFNLFVFMPTIAPKGISTCSAQSGCCSWHGGVSGCDDDIGRTVCNDNTYSPSCGCQIIYSPSCRISVSPSTITWGSSASLSWNSSNALSVSNSNFNGFGTSGNTSISPKTSTVYSLTVRNNKSYNNTATCTAAITVNDKVEVKDETKQESIYVPDKIVEVNTEPKGWQSIVDPGVVGVKEINYKVTFTNDAETKRDIVSQPIKVEPKEKVIKRGTMDPVQYYLGVTKNKIRDNAVLYALLTLALVSGLIYFFRENINKLLKGQRK